MDLNRKETQQVDLRGPLIKYAKSILTGVVIYSQDKWIGWID